MTRIYHTYEKWECYPAGFYESAPGEKRTKEDCEKQYAELLRDKAQFKAALARVILEWVRSCEHYLSNDKMNRIAWLGQASLCIAKGIPSSYRNGFNRLNEAEQQAANEMALAALNRWLELRGEPAVTMEQAGVNSKADLY